MYLHISVIQLKNAWFDHMQAWIKLCWRLWKQNKNSNFKAMNYQKTAFNLIETSFISIRIMRLSRACVLPPAAAGAAKHKEELNLGWL